MHLSRDPEGALCDVADAELLKRFSALGRLSKVAARRALALLPEIIRRGLYRKAGFASPYEFAYKKVGVTRDVVEKVLRLHQRIGHMPELWGLLVSGSEGWTKLEIIASVATPGTASWWAERLPRYSRAELAEHVRRLRTQHDPKPAQAGSAAIEFSHQVASMARCSGLSRAAEASTLSAPSTDLDPGVCSAHATAGARTAPPCGVPGDPLPGTLFDAPPQQAAVPVLPGLRSVTLYLVPGDDDLLRALQDQIGRQRGEAISLGEVVGLVLRKGTEAACAPASGTVAGSDAQGETPLDPRDSQGERSPDPDPVGGGVAAGDRAACTAVLHRTVEVVLRVAELGAPWAVRFKGILPAGLAGAFRRKDAVVLGDLYSAAVSAAVRCRGEVVPVPVRKFVSLRAQFKCEMPGCGRPIQEIHHLAARSEGGDHHPDNCQALCRVHHGTAHVGIFSDGRTGVAVKPGDRAPSRPADMAFQLARARAVAAGS